MKKDKLRNLDRNDTLIEIGRLVLIGLGVLVIITYVSVKVSAL